MPYPSSGASLRADILTVVEEAQGVDSMFIGDKVFPAYEQPAKTGQYPKWKLGNGELLNADVTVRSPGTAYGRIIRAYDTDSFLCEDRGIEEAVDDTYKKDVSRYFDAEAASAKICLRKIRIGHESRVSAAVMSTTNFGSGLTPIAAYTAANLATINFVADVKQAIAALEGVGVIPNTIVMSKAVFDRVALSTIFIGYLRGSKSTDSRVNASASSVVEVLRDDGIENCYIGRAPKNSAAKGQTFATTPIWPNTYIWVGYVAGGDPMNGGAGRTMVWNEEGGLFVAETYRDEQHRSDIIRVRQNTAEKVIDGTAGKLITTSYS